MKFIGLALAELTGDQSAGPTEYSVLRLYEDGTFSTLQRVSDKAQAEKVMDTTAGLDKKLHHVDGRKLIVALLYLYANETGLAGWGTFCRTAEVPDLGNWPARASAMLKALSIIEWLAPLWDEPDTPKRVGRRWEPSKWALKLALSAYNERLRMFLESNIVRQVTTAELLTAMLKPLSSKPSGECACEKGSPCDMHAASCITCFPRCGGHPGWVSLRERHRREKRRALSAQNAKGSS